MKNITSLSHFLFLSTFLAGINICSATEEEMAEAQEPQAESSAEMEKGTEDVPPPSEDFPELKYSLTQEEVKKLIEKFAPISHEHPKEKYHLGNVEDFIKKSTLYCFYDVKLKGAKSRLESKNVALKEESPTIDFLNEVVTNPRYQKGRKCRLILKPSQKSYFSGDISKAKTYVNVYQGENGYLILQFIFFAPFNGKVIKGKLSGDALSSIGLGDLGTHEGDWEHFDVHLLKNNSGEYDLIRTHYAGHQQRMGVMLMKQQMATRGLLNNNSKPIVYSGLYSHANIPGIGDNNQLGFEGALDVTAKNTNPVDFGKPERYEIIMVNGEILPQHSWINFLGPWGNTNDKDWGILSSPMPNSPTGPLEARWLRKNNEPSSLTYDLIDNPDKFSEPMKALTGTVKIPKGKKESRGFIYESPSRLTERFSVEFFNSKGSKLTIPATQYKISFNGVTASQISPTENNMVLFKRPASNLIKNTKVLLTTPRREDIYFKLVGYEFNKPSDK